MKNCIVIPLFYFVTEVSQSFVALRNFVANTSDGNIFCQELSLLCSSSLGQSGLSRVNDFSVCSPFNDLLVMMLREAYYNRFNLSSLLLSPAQVGLPFDNMKLVVVRWFDY
ncbi:hypothetical protein QQP08_026947 [Theobroma cacao]|nr:hypothetical protein QQP08_026503 [Theobroma cacao]WRX34460.1 hypothetical protein QQP08_026947 [Theobroma cacao]